MGGGSLPSAESTFLAKPEVEHFDARHPATLMLAGFKSRWTIPCSCAASSAAAICLAMSSASPTASGPSAMQVGKRRAIDQRHDQAAHSVSVLDAIDGSDVRVI